MRKVIVNTTPLIALCHVGQLELLKKIYGQIMIPQRNRHTWCSDKGKAAGVYKRVKTYYTGVDR